MFKLQLILANQYLFDISWEWEYLLGIEQSTNKIVLFPDRKDELINKYFLKLYLPDISYPLYAGRCKSSGCYQPGEYYWKDIDSEEPDGIYCIDCAYDYGYCDFCHLEYCECPNNYYCDPVYDNEDEDEYYYYPSEVLEQQSIITEEIYEGNLLISEILKQQEKLYVLATKYMLIADIDCGNQIDRSLQILSNFVEKYGGSFRVYKTKNGMRYLQTDLGYQGANNPAIFVLKELNSDPEYINLCASRKRFMARLTPKIEPKLALQYFEDLKQGKLLDMRVCEYIKTVGSGEIFSMLNDSIELHDFVTGANRKDLESQLI